jgi:putative FmdB family regulatory protein
MPIFEYQCEVCHTTFERLVFASSSGVAPACPQCHSVQTVKRFSTFSAQTGGGTGVPATSGPPAFR